MADHSLPVLRWADPPDGPMLVLLDQRRLPTAEVEVVCTDVPGLVAAIQSLAVRGAPLLGIAGAYGIALAAARGYDVGEAARSLTAARPTAVNLAYGVERAVAAHRAVGGDGPAAAAAALAEARALHREDAVASDRMAELGLELLGELLPGGGYRLLTHCNTGALVSGGHGTAFAVVRAAHRAGELRRLWVDETRPLLQGARLTAWEAAREEMSYAVLADAAAGSLFAAGEVDAVLIGADRISADGSVANKVGSYPLAVLARHHGVPFVVVAPVSTVDAEAADAGAIPIEQRPGHEVTDIGPGVPVAPVGAQAYNPAFDVTPAELVTAIVTERGVVAPVNGGNLTAVCSGSPGVGAGKGDGMMKA
ncbi:S-methyl-5-thioribose-1-phosphate isomerase [Streptomyces radicis]|uniref:Methylthioribose-1-phosphate isomerase n=1 Tax=Streptomyces radicis TaxID=1750517 RepID=A0A3A9W4K4_9ACTN|nr:S-methyl-5-thioribose-1-phosphate isomerase [Streptomyces radicis]RKN07780.1 S-methyl-5-thioribose-1-phosphate isomerase [Streptomyces radicis]RKN20764.1 S-methyl-5-thioribose-1-phosphate isomerase [Streptomyces radicis]